MKKVLFLAALLLVSFTGMAQAQTSRKSKEELKKEVRKEKREERKVKDSIVNAISFEQAYQALKDKSFVLEADNLIFWNGVTRFVSPNTNFVGLNGNEATVQFAFNNGYLGPNGIGGITVDGNASGIRMNTDKDGNVFFDMNVMGINISATLTIILTKDSNRASVTVNPNFTGNNMTFTGNLYPASLSNVYKANPNIFPNLLLPIR